MELDNFKYNLSRLKKCDQYWNEMKPVNGGRLCDKCDKKIVDFSKMNFTDIAFFMSESDEPICGFYLPEQLKQTKTAKRKFPVAIGLTTLLTTSTISKAEKIHDKTEQSVLETESFQKTKSEISTSEDTNKVDTVYLIGKIQYLDSTTNTNEPIPFATIIIKGSRIGTTASPTGDFKLRYETPNDTKIYLRINSVGFETKEIEIIYSSQKEINLGTISLEKNKNEITEFWVTVKKRSKLSRFWRKITKPFRRH